MEKISDQKAFSGAQQVWRHASKTLSCDMRFSIFLPPEEVHGKGPHKVLYWLSGLTCTEDNFAAKAGAQRIAAELGLAIVAPDTSPRGNDVPDLDPKMYDFGKGAGFYLDATEKPWAEHYRMYSYITEELPVLVGQHFSVDHDRAGIFGHSMGGHGALTIHLKNQNRFKSCSAFSPIVAPASVPWGVKAFSNYLGENRETWAPYDATQLLRDRGASCAHILIDQGAADQFLTEQLRPELFTEAAREAGQKLTLRMHDGYDHSYFFIASFIEGHLRWHDEALG
ncbi:MAG: S-formylglutathione hydrolase [Parvularculaceae bacterium]